MRTTSLRWLAALTVLTALIGTSACKKKDGATEAAKAAMASDVGAISMPASIIGFAGARSMDDLTGTISSIASKFAPELGAMLGDQIPALLRGKVLGIKNLSWLDSQKPIKVVVVDFKVYAKPLIFLLPIKSNDLLSAALPDNKAPAAPDNETRFASPNGTPVFLNTVGDYAVFTLDEKVFATAKAFLEGDFSRYAFSEILDVQISSTNVQLVAGAELAKAKEGLETSLGQDPTAQLLPGMADLIKKEIEMLLDVVKQTQYLRLVLRWDNADLDIAASLKVVDGLGLSKFVADTGTRKMELYKTLPGDAWLVFASNIDPKTFAGWTELGIDFWMKSLQMTPEESAQLKQLSEEAMAVQKGDNALYFGREGEFPLRILTATAVTDGTKAKAVTYALYKMLLGKAGAAIERNAGPELKALPKLDWTSTTSLITGLQPVLATSGVTAGIKEATVGELSADVVDISVDYSKVPGGASAAEIERVARMIGNKVSGALAFDKTRMYFGFGRDAVADLGALSKASAGTTSTLAPIIDKAGFTPALAVWLSVVDLLKVVAYFDPSFVRNFPGLATAKPDAGLSFVIGGRNYNLLDLRLGIPVARLADLMPKPGQAPGGGAPMAPPPAAPPVH
jgi:hypothetical protein